MGLLFADISLYQSGVTWSKVQLPLVFMRATEGVAFRDSAFASHVAGAKSRGIPYGAYHFLDHGNGAAQARNFLGALGDLSQYFGFQLDIESNTLVAQDVADFMAVWRAATTRPIFQYGPQGVLSRCSGPQYGPLWLALYPGGGYPGDNYATWNLHFAGWTGPTLWQYGSMADPGFPKRIDGDAFRGTLDELAALMNPEAASVITLKDKPLLIGDILPGAIVFAEDFLAHLGTSVAVAGSPVVGLARPAASGVLYLPYPFAGKVGWIQQDHVKNLRTPDEQATLAAQKAADAAALAAAVAQQKTLDQAAIDAAVTAANVLTAKVNAAKAALG